MKIQLKYGDYFAGTVDGFGARASSRASDWSRTVCTPRSMSASCLSLLKRSEMDQSLIGHCTSLPGTANGRSLKAAPRGRGAQEVNGV